MQVRVEVILVILDFSLNHFAILDFAFQIADTAQLASTLVIEFVSWHKVCVEFENNEKIIIHFNVNEVLED